MIFTKDSPNGELAFFKVAFDHCSHITFIQKIAKFTRFVPMKMLAANNTTHIRINQPRCSRIAFERKLGRHVAIVLQIGNRAEHIARDTAHIHFPMWRYHFNRATIDTAFYGIAGLRFRVPNDTSNINIIREIRSASHLFRIDDLCRIGTAKNAASRVANNAAHIGCPRNRATLDATIENGSKFIVRRNHAARDTTGIISRHHLRIGHIHILHNTAQHVGNGANIISRIATEGTVCHIDVADFAHVNSDGFKHGILGIQAINSMPAAIKAPLKEGLVLISNPFFRAKLRRVRAKNNIVFQIGSKRFVILSQYRCRIQEPDKFFWGRDFVVVQTITLDDLR